LHKKLAGNTYLIHRNKNTHACIPILNVALLPFFLRPQTYKLAICMTPSCAKAAESREGPEAARLNRSSRIVPLGWYGPVSGLFGDSLRRVNSRTGWVHQDETLPRLSAAGGRPLVVWQRANTGGTGEDLYGRTLWTDGRP
jgi:hypothetical protein